MTTAYPKIAQLKSPAELRDRLDELGVDLPVDDRILTADEDSPLAAPLDIGDLHVGNRWCIHPMEGWDANRDGSPSAHTLRRWRRFGESGAKLIWGGEAAAVREDGRANPNQTLAPPANAAGLAQLLNELTAAHRSACGETADLLVGLQLTHSGRFCRPNSKQLEPRIAYHHPQLDEKFGIDPDDDAAVLTDAEVDSLVDSYLAAARTAQEVGFRFVDIKSCHGYLMHEFLSAGRRPGRYGGDLAGRSRLLRNVVERVRTELPELAVFVRLSVYDMPPFKTSRQVGEPMPFALPYNDAFGHSPADPLVPDLSEPLELIGMLRDWGVTAINVSCASPYYNPHLMRPAIFPPSDGYLPPEDPLVGVCRLIHAARKCKAAHPKLTFVGSGFTYLQDYLPHVAQAVVRAGWVDSVGIGRMVLSYPDLPTDTLRKGQLRRRSVCRTFSDCTTAPRNALISGCFPLDDYYKDQPEAEQLREFKQERKEE